MNVKKAEAAANFERVLKVRGREARKEMTAPMAPKPTVQRVWPMEDQRTSKSQASTAVLTTHGIEVTRDGQNVQTLFSVSWDESSPGFCNEPT